jgi:hypothetical protein
MDAKADILCRRIELYRRHLREGVDAASSVHYLYEIFAAEDELAELLRPSRDESDRTPRFRIG